MRAWSLGRRGSEGGGRGGGAHWRKLTVKACLITAERFLSYTHGTLGLRPREGGVERVGGTIERTECRRTLVGVQAERFLSDIGGTVGLWIGASLLGLGEALEFLYFSLVLLYKRVWGDKISLGGSRGLHTAASNNGYSRDGAEPSDGDRHHSNVDLVNVSTAAV